MTTVTFKGTEIQVKGSFPKPGDRAPSFSLIGQDMSEVSLESYGRKKKLLNIFPSIDTPVCAKSVHTFYEQCQSIPNLVVLNISMDLPFATARFCKSEQMENVITLSTFRSSFPDDYGVRIVEGLLKGLCARTVLVLNEENQVRYSEMITEIIEEPNYTAALNALS